MRDIEISTLAKAGYVIVTAAGQNVTNLTILGEMFKTVFPSITKEVIAVGESMSMKKMVENITKFTEPHTEATELMGALVHVFYQGKSYLLAVELEKLLKNKRFNPGEMPELSARLNADFQLYGNY